MKIRHIKIRNFRGIKTLDLSLPEKSIYCFIGKGDSSKTTILEAIRYVFYPSWNLGINDSDFYNSETYDKASKSFNLITIEIVLGDLLEEFFSFEKYGNYLHGWDKKAYKIVEEPSDILEPVLIIRLRINGEDLEPTWEVLDETYENGIPYKQADRIKTNANFIGNHTDRQLTWGRGSILNQLTDSENLTAMFNEASRGAKQSLDAQRNDKLKSFDEAALKAETIAKSIGVPVKNKFIAQLDLSTLNIHQGGLALHDGDIPVRQLGLGSRRMLISAIQKETIGQMHITLIDEIEIGLEPHRITRLIKHIRNDNTGQYFITTHSPTTLRELTAEDLYIVQSRDGDVSVIPIADSALKNIQGNVRAHAEALLAQKVIICEGATEIGFARGLDNYWAGLGLLPYAYQGVAIINANGASKIKNIAEGFNSLFYEVAVIADGDAPEKFSEEDAQGLIQKGVNVTRWSNLTTLEERIFLDIPWPYVLASVTLAKNEFDKPVIENINSKSTKVMDEKIENWPDSIDLRKSIGNSAVTKAGPLDRCWFKDISRAERWLHVISPSFSDEAIKQTELVKEIDKIRIWIDQ